MANRLTYIKLIIVADLVKTSICLGSEEMVCVTIIVKNAIIASSVPIFDFNIKPLFSINNIFYKFISIIVTIHS